MNLERIPFKPTRYPGVWVHFFHYDARTRHAALLIKMEPGCSYPAHRHSGPEELLVLQGGYRDEAGEHRALEFVRYEDGSVHRPVALEEGQDCILFAIAAEGIDFLAP